MTQLEKILYTGKTRTTGGRDGAARSSDGRLDVRLSPPGSTGTGTNPEQLLAAGWSACFIGAIRRAAGDLKVTVPAGVSVDAEVDLGNTAAGDFGLAARLNVGLPGLDHDTATQLVEAAHRLCPYSRALTGNIAIELRAFNPAEAA